MGANDKLLDIPFSELNIDQARNCRRGTINLATLADLAQDIKTNGLIQPVLVRPYSNPAEPQFKYILVAGFRRCLAQRDVLGWETVKAIVRTDLDDASAQLMNISENLNRTNLDILEEAMAVDRLLKGGMSRSRLLSQLGTYPRWLDVRLDLLKLPADVQEAAAMGFIKAGEIPDLYNIFTMAGKTELYRVVRHVKELRLQGRTNVNRLIKPISDKRVRTRGELNTMLFHLMSTIGEGLHSRVLAWATGEITDDDIYDDIASFAAIREIEYVKPTDLMRKTNVFDQVRKE